MGVCGSVCRAGDTTASSVVSLVGPAHYETATRRPLLTLQGENISLQLLSLFEVVCCCFYGHNAVQILVVCVCVCVCADIYIAYIVL